MQSNLLPPTDPANQLHLSTGLRSEYSDAASLMLNLLQCQSALQHGHAGADHAVEDSDLLTSYTASNV